MLEYIILGILQGVFEWLPISSEGVIAFVSQIFGKENVLDLALFLHLGTLLSLFVYFFNDWRNILFLKDKKLFKFILIVSIVSFIIGFPLYNLIGNFVIGAGLLILMGFGLVLTSYFQSHNKKITISEGKLAVLVGVLQGLSVIPGLSRSGSTIFGLSFSSKSSFEILKLSYIISAPVVLGSSLYLAYKNFEIVSYGWIAVLFSFIFGLLTLDVLLKISQKINFSKFTLFFGILCLIGGCLSFLY